MNDVSGGAGGERPTPRREASGTISGAQFAGVGLQFAVTIVVFAFAGIWLDRHLGTSPWLVILFVFVGAAAGFFSIYRQVMSAARRKDDRGSQRR